MSFQSINDVRKERCVAACIRNDQKSRGEEENFCRVGWPPKCEMCLNLDIQMHIQVIYVHVMSAACKEKDKTIPITRKRATKRVDGRVKNGCTRTLSPSRHSCSVLYMYICNWVLNGRAKEGWKARRALLIQLVGPRKKEAHSDWRVSNGVPGTIDEENWH